MLELRPNCELCDRDLPPDSTDACICTYECTFCRACVDGLLQNVCPNCGGGFAARPIRPKTARRAAIGLDFQPATKQRVNTKYRREQIAEFVATVAGIAAQRR